MSKHINSAYRIFEIFENAKKGLHNEQVLDVWTKCFGIDEDDHQQKTFAVSECLSLMHEEINSVSQQMSGTEFSDNLYVPALSKARTIISVNAFENSWGSYFGNITPEMQVSLQFCSEILPDEESEIDLEALNEIRDLNRKLLENISSSKLPSYVIGIIEKHSRKIELALQKYGVVGAKALQEVMESAYGDVVINEDTFLNVRDTSEISKLTTVWRKVQSTLDGVVKIEKGIESGTKIVKASIKAIEYFDRIFPD